LDRYYSPISALPYLTYDGEAAPEIDEFLDACRTTLKPEDWDLVSSIELGSDEHDSDNPTYAAWLKWERSLRSELARLRAQKRSVDSAPFVKEAAHSQVVLDTARSAFAETAPEHAEEILLRAMWRCLDDLEVGHHFDVDKLIVYFLKLRILDLKRRRNKEDGLRMFSAQYEAIRTRQ